MLVFKQKFGGSIWVFSPSCFVIFKTVVRFFNDEIIIVGRGRIAASTMLCPHSGGSCKHIKQFVCPQSDHPHLSFLYQWIYYLGKQVDPSHSLENYCNMLCPHRILLWFRNYCQQEVYHYETLYIMVKKCWDFLTCLWYSGLCYQNWN